MMSLVVLNPDRQSISAHLSVGRTIELPAYAVEQTGVARMNYNVASAMIDQTLHDHWLGRVYDERPPLDLYQRHENETITRDGVRWVRTADVVDIEREDAARAATIALGKLARGIRNGGFRVSFGNPAVDYYSVSNGVVEGEVALFAAHSTDPIDWKFFDVASQTVTTIELNESQVQRLGRRLARHFRKVRRRRKQIQTLIDGANSTAQIRTIVETVFAQDWPENAPAGVIELLE